MKMDLTVSELMTNFLDSPLVVWVKTFGPLTSNSEDNLSLFMELVDGVFLHKIMTHIDPSPTNQRVNKHVNNDVNLRVQNLNVVVRHIKTYYQECLQQLIVMNLPNVLAIGKDPLSEKAMEEMKRLLLLILGCAVQCERKEEFIEKIKLLDIETQAAIVSHIQEVTHNQENVLDLQWLELAELPPEELDSLSRIMAFHLRKLIDERDSSAEVIVELIQERDYLLLQQPSSPPPVTRAPACPPLEGPVTLLCREDRQHLAVELADCKARLRRWRQELEEKTEQLVDAKNEVERLEAEMKGLKQESMQLLAEARAARAYRDELDALRERAGRGDRLEAELARCKERLNDVHFYRARVEELRGDNATLLETKALLEEQLMVARSRCDRLHELEKENLQLRSKLHDMDMDRDMDKKRIEELVEENMLLEISQKRSMNESAHLGWELEQQMKNSDSSQACKSFVLELNESASSQLLKLEKENQGLQGTIQELREAALSMQESQLRALELEKENQGLGKKLERLQTLLEQEKQTSQDMGSLGEELLKGKRKLERLLEAVQTEKCRQISDLTMEKERLAQTVASLRQRAQVEGEARVREVEEENRALHQSISTTSAQLTQLEVEQDRLRERAQRAEQLEEEVARLVRSCDQLQKQSAALQAAREHAEALERNNSALEQDNRRLKKLEDAAQNTVLQLETLEEENTALRQQVEALRPVAAKLPQLQRENTELERERAELAHSVEELRGLGKKAERLELSYQDLDSENQRLRQSLEESGERVRGLERELHDFEQDSQQLRRELEERRAAGRRLEILEQEGQVLEQELGQAVKERRQLEKEARRLRQQLEVKETALEEGMLRTACLEKEGRLREKELNYLRETSAKVKELESENKELQKQATIDRRTLATLREDLVNEKLKGQQQWNELEKLSQELEKIGLNRERLLQEEHSCEDIKYKILETKIDSTLKMTMEIRQEKIQGLESRLQESTNLNLQLRTELATVKRSLEAQKQRQEEAHLYTTSPKAPGPRNLWDSKEKWETEEREATAELLKLKDRLIDVEKNNAALETEKQLQREQLKQLDVQNTQLSAQILALQRQTAALQEHNTALHMQMAKLQVESSTLGSQSASLLAQNTALQGQMQALETQAEKLRQQGEEERAGREAALHEHERLLELHDRQAAEYEQLIGQHTCLKGTHRALEQEHRLLESKYRELQTQRGAMEELEAALLQERESLGEEIRKNALVQGDNQNLRVEVERLTQTHSHLRQEYDILQQHLKELKTSMKETQLELNSWRTRYDQLKEQHQGLDISFTKLENQCELLTRLKGNLEEENHHLMGQIQVLGQRNQALLEQSIESKELYHEEQKQYIDKLNTLRRQKEKLEEKIMDQYRFYDPIPKKKNHWVGAKALVKLMKPRKDSLQERVQNVPEMSLSPPLSPGCPGGASPPLPPRQSCLSLESVASHSLVENCIPSPTAVPNHNAKALDNGTASKAMDPYRTPGGSSESVNSPEGVPVRQKGVKLGYSAHSTSAIHAMSDTRPGCSPQGFSSEVSPPAHLASFGHQTKESFACDDATDPHWELKAEEGVTFPDDTRRQDRRPRPGRPRPSSPGSEMVTLEQFLQESSVLSAPIDGTKAPTSCATPTVKPLPLGGTGEPRAQKPGQSVKPNIRLPEMPTSSQQSQTLPSWVGGSLGVRVCPSQPADIRGGLSRTFSLASADLLHSSGPESYRPEGSDWGSGDAVLRARVVARERPQSVRLGGPSAPPVDVGCRPLDPRRLSLAPPKESFSLESLLPLPQHHSSSFSLCGSPGYTSKHGVIEQHPKGNPGSPQLPQHRATEIAMVTPVQAVPVVKEEDEREMWQDVRQESSPQIKGQEALGALSVVDMYPKSTPAPPTPSEDPQTIWYEYGCV
ncbi:protein Daple-like isoform X2 [Brienomyrus brachyistius]|uniref:protein Daple-like isoform X2 n=1 Tax=Brienomyrus brachyistius TaxID=42636 RepID=UPI0020B35CC8|nr:protein Daple-like isoform X2 [Brienomyrus brachyistius]